MKSAIGLITASLVLIAVLFYYVIAIDYPRRQAYCHSRNMEYANIGEGAFCEDKNGALYRLRD